VDENTQLKIKKQKFLQYQIDKLDEAASDKVEGIMVVVFDREEAYFALLKKFGYTLLSELKGKVQKKADMDSNTTNFYQEIYAQIQEYFQRYNLDQIIVASPSFWKEYLMKEVKDDNIKKKIIQATCSSADRSGINEVLKREELQQALKNQKAAKELQIVERLLAEIAKGDKATYGLKGTTEALNIGATKSVLITDNLIFKKRDEESTEIEDLLKIADSTKTDVHIISSDHDGGKKLDGLGGIAAILRYKIT
jgi:protein pelota